jgi:hypothetical protein
MQTFRHASPAMILRRKKGIHRKIVLPVLAVGALVIAGVALSASGPNAQLASQNRVYGGGDFNPGGTQRNFAVDAHTDGTVAFGDVEFGTVSFYRHEQVLCLNVSGNKATIGAVITQSTNPEIPVGWLVLWVLVDNGPPNSGTPDQTPFQLLGPTNDPGWPSGFPSTCPSPDAATALFGLDYFPFTGGDVVVQTAK